MGKSGRGVLLIITDVAAAQEAEVNDWYDHEHLEERVAITGFLCARRYRAISAERTYLAAYETETIAALDSPEYRTKLANQTDRSKRALKQFVRPHRAIARFAASEGLGVGGAISVTHVAGTSGEDVRSRIAAQLLPKILAQPGIVAAHLLECDARLSQPLPETAGAVATPLAAPNDWFVFAEGSNADAVQAADKLWQTAEFQNIPTRRIGAYLLMSSMSRGDL